MRQTDYKVDRIKVFIQLNKPTRSELVKHIVVDINKRVSSKLFEKNSRTFRGYYSANIKRMRNAGNIATDKNGKYYVTKEASADGRSLYVKSDKVKIAELKSYIKNKNAIVNSKQSELNELYNEITRLKRTLESIKFLSS